MQNTALVAEYLRNCPGLQELVRGLAAWMALEVQRWSRYTIFMMVVMYLQTHQQLPNLQALAKTCSHCNPQDSEPSTKKLKSDDAPMSALTGLDQWDYRFCSHCEVGAATRNLSPAEQQAWLGHHFLHLLIYYANGWELGKVLPHFLIHCPSSTPTAEFDAKRHVVSIRHGEPLSIKRVHRGMWLKSGVAVEDPFELSHNIASRITEEAWQ